MLYLEFCVQCSTSSHHIGSHSKIVDALEHLGEALHKNECCDAGDGVVDCLISNCARVSRFRMQKMGTDFPLTLSPCFGFKEGDAE